MFSETPKIFDFVGVSWGYYTTFLTICNSSTGLVSSILKTHSISTAIRFSLHCPAFVSIRFLQKNSSKGYLSRSFFGGQGGIRTHGTVRYTWFRAKGNIFRTTPLRPWNVQYFHLFCEKSKNEWFFARNLRDRCEKPIKTFVCSWAKKTQGE